MNHIRGFFRPSPATRVAGQPSVKQDAKAKNSASPQQAGERPARTSPKPRRERSGSPTPHESAPAPPQPPATTTTTAERRGSATSSVVNGAALDHLYEHFRDNVTASEQRSRSAERRACMVMREYSDDFVAPATSRNAIFLPREYNIVGDEDDEEGGSGGVMSGSEGFSDLLTRTQGGTTLLKDSPADSAVDATLTNITAGLDAQVDSESDEGSPTVVPRPPPTNVLTTSKVLRLSGEEELERRHTPGPPNDRLRSKQKLVRNARHVSPPSAEVATPPERRAGPQMRDTPVGVDTRASTPAQQQRRGSNSSWSFMEEEARLQGRVCRVVVPSTAARDDAQDGTPDWRPSEVAVVRLNDALFTNAELARWRRYQVARMDSFMEAGNEAATPSTSTRSRDVPSSNSASGPEFMPMLGAGNTSASETSARAWEETEMVAGEGEEEVGGVPPPRGRLIRVCYDGPHHSQPPPSPPKTQETMPPTIAAHVATAEATTSIQRAASLMSYAEEPRVSNYHHRRSASASSSSSSSGSSRTNSHSCRSSHDSDTDGRDVLHEDGGSQTSTSASRSPSETSLEDDSTTTTVAAIPDVVQLPSIDRSPHHHPRPNARMAAAAELLPGADRVRGSGASGSTPSRTSQGSAAEEFRPLPPVIRPQGNPTFQRRVHS